MVENLLVNMARRGQIGGQLGETELKGLLEQVSEQTKQNSTVKFDRRRAALDDDDE
jgi:programmed cell death protein 5